jgi:hypothetical protein
MPLTNCVSFNTELQKRDRIQIPRLIRWQYKLECNQILSVKVSGRLFVREQFFAKMSRDGRITIPRVSARLLREELGKERRLEDYVLEVTLQPADSR